MNGSDRQKLEEQLLEAAIVRLRAWVMALVFGMAGGTGMLFATLWLLVRGGDNVGRHLSLLNNYFPGYSVTWPGALLGFFYGALAGMAVGWSIAWIYNVIASARSSS